MKILFKYLSIYIIFLHFRNFNGDISLLVLGVPNTFGLSTGSADDSGARSDAGSSAVFKCNIMFFTFKSFLCC